MIIWITGQSGSGKTTLAEQMKTKNSIILDGDIIRKIYNTGFSKKERVVHNLKVAKFAKMLSDQGFDVIVSLICPYKYLRKKCKEITNCSFIYLSNGKIHKDYPYEYEKNKFYLRKDENCSKMMREFKW